MRFVRCLGTFVWRSLGVPFELSVSGVKRTLDTRGARDVRRSSWASLGVVDSVGRKHQT